MVPPPHRSFMFAVSRQVCITKPLLFSFSPLSSPHSCDSYSTRRCSHSNYAASNSYCSHCHESGGQVMHHPFSATSSRFRASVPMQRLTRRLWHFLDAKVRNLSDLESIFKKIFSFRVGLTADNHAACSGFIAPAALLRLTCQLKPESSHHRCD